MDPMVYRLFENKRKLCEASTPDELYKEYLAKHRQGVREVYEEIILPILEKNGVDVETLNKIESLIDSHDASKDGPEEFGPYRDYFYDSENNPRSSEAFNLAWNHHQKHNPHHWNYWVLINDVDEPQLRALDMPFEYIIEMLCDWQSAGTHYGNTAYDWYEKQGDKMILSDNTRNVVEQYIKYLR